MYVFKYNEHFRIETFILLRIHVFLMKLKINWDHKRAKHAIERMWLRGISQKDIALAVQRGQRRKQRESGLIESLYSYYSVVYAEYVLQKHNLRKIYPVTVKIW